MKLLTLGAFALLLVGCASSRSHHRNSVAARPLKLIITGSDGQRFTGRYGADGVKNDVRASVPHTINFQASDVTYEFMKEGGKGELRVAAFEGDSGRTSATSDKRQGVRGWLRYTGESASWGAGGF